MHGLFLFYDFLLIRKLGIQNRIEYTLYTANQLINW